MNSKAILTIVLAIAAIAASAASAWAQPPTAFSPPNPNAVLSVMPLAGGAYWIEGGIANTGFVVGDKGVVVIDAQMFVATAKNAQAAISKITPKPIDVMILTHSDPDHINGLSTYPMGLQVISHPNTKSDMVAALANPKPSFTAPPKALNDYLPTRLVAARETLVLDGVRMVLIHVAPAHTDGDLVVFLPNQKVVFAGDLLTPAIGPYPGIHLEKHGSSLGWIKSAKALLALKADTFISGHGMPLTRAEIQARIKAAEARRAQIAGLVAQHKTLAEVKAVLQDQPLVGAAARFPTFTETTFQELTAGQRP